MCTLSACAGPDGLDEASDAAAPAASLDGAMQPPDSDGAASDAGFDATRSSDGGATPWPGDAMAASGDSAALDGAGDADGPALDSGADAAGSDADADSSAPAGDAAIPADGATASDAQIDAAPAAPAQLPAKTGTCPEFVSGDATFSPAGIAARKVRLWAGASGGGPLVIYWHSTGAQPSEAETTGLNGVISQITGAGGVVAAPYTGANDGTFPWLTTTAESLTVADEVVACALEKKSIDRRRIHVIGFSAGGLMTSTMSFKRSSYVASVAPYSGGQQSSTTFEDASNKFAALIFYGGSSDTFIINFQSTSAAYNTALRNNGNYTIMCNHDGGHHIPSAGPAAAWRFFQDHPFGTNPSPYVASGLPSSLPSYCQAQP
jgi:poly(3-hydroxybutyrate) depolymerase